MFSLVKAALVVATLVVQSTAMAITSNQLTNETATISFGDQLKLDLRRQEYPVSKFDCVQIFVTYSEPTSKTLTLYLTSAMLNGAGTNAESSLSLTPGKFTVHVKADTTEGTKNLNCVAPDIAITGQYEGTTNVIDFYSPSARNILVVLVRTGIISSIESFSDDLFDKRYAPIFSQFQSCPSVRVDENCPHTIEVSTINPAHGEVPFDLAVADGEEWYSYKVQYDHVQKIAISSAYFTTKSDIKFIVDASSSREWFFTEEEAPFNTLFSVDSGITIENLNYGDATAAILDNNELFVTKRESTELPPYGDDAPYNAFRKNHYASEVTDAQAPFAHQRKWDSLAINPKNFVMYQVVTTETAQDFVLSIPPGSMCLDGDGTDSIGNTCAAYVEAPICGAFDVTEPKFAANELCCACGGGTQVAKIEGTLVDIEGTLVDGTGDSASKYILLKVGNLVNAGWTDNGNLNLPTGTEAINTTHLTELSATELSSLLQFKDTTANANLLTIALTADGADSDTVQKPIDVFPGNLEYTVTAYGNERDPDHVSEAQSEAEAEQKTHHCDINANDPAIACATSELKLETSITNSAEVRIGTQVAHQPIFSVPAAGDITHVDTSTVDATVNYGFGVGAAYDDSLDANPSFANALLPHGYFSVTLTDADIGEEYHKLNGRFEVVQNDVPMQACNKRGCAYEDCPAIPGIGEVDVWIGELDASWISTVNGNFETADNGFTVSVPSPTEIQFDFDWRPKFDCPAGSSWCADNRADVVNGDTVTRTFERFDYRLRLYGTTYCQYSFKATDTTSQIDADNENVDDLSSGTVLVMIRVHPVSAGYLTELASYVPPSVSFSALAMSQIHDNQVDVENYLIVEAHNTYSHEDGSYNENHIGAVKVCSANPPPADEHSLGIKTEDNDELCCEINKDEEWSTDDEDVDYASNQRKFTFKFSEFSVLGGTPFVDFKGDNIKKVADPQTHGDSLFYKLCFVARRNIWPYDDMPILLDNSIERITTSPSGQESYVHLESGELGCEAAGYFTIHDVDTCNAAIEAIFDTDGPVQQTGTGCGSGCTYGCGWYSVMEYFAVNVNTALIGESCDADGWSCLCATTPSGHDRRTARQQGDDSAQNVQLPPSNQLFLDFSADGVLTVSFDDQQQPVISVEPNDEIAPQKEVSTTSPQLEDENNTTEQITTTLLGLIIGAVLILLVIVVIAVMMLNKRKEAAAKVYPFWMPGTDVTKTTVQA